MLQTVLGKNSCFISVSRYYCHHSCAILLSTVSSASPLRVPYEGLSFTILSQTGFLLQAQGEAAADFRGERLKDPPCLLLPPPLPCPRPHPGLGKWKPGCESSRRKKASGQGLLQPPRGPTWHSQASPPSKPARYRLLLRGSRHLEAN